MQSLTKYSVGDWIYGVVASLIAAVIFAAVVFILRWIWHWIRNFSAEYRRSDQTARIIKIFVYRRYIQRANVYSLSRGQFFVISRCLQMFIVGVIFVAMGSFISWITDIHIAFYLFVGLAVWMFVEAASWLDARWLKDRSTTWMSRHSLTPRLSWGRHPMRFEVTLSTQRSNHAIQRTAGRPDV